MTIPLWLSQLQSWIVTLSPVMTVLILVLWKPAKVIFIRIYNHFVQEPDTKNKHEINHLEERLDRMDKNVERLINDREEDKGIYVALLHHEIFQTARQTLKKGKISEHELENLEELYIPYKKLGGNGTAEKLYSDCKSLPIDHGEN